MTRRLIHSVVLLGLCLVVSNNAIAQLEDHAELNVFGAGSVFSTNNFETGFPQSPVVPIPGRLKFSSNFRGGVRFGMYMGGHWGEEAYYSYQPTTMTIITAGTAPSTKDFHLGVNNY